MWPFKNYYWATSILSQPSSLMSRPVGLSRTWAGVLTGPPCLWLGQTRWCRLKKKRLISIQKWRDTTTEGKNSRAALVWKLFGLCHSSFNWFRNVFPEPIYIYISKVFNVHDTRDKSRNLGVNKSWSAYSTGICSSRGRPIYNYTLYPLFDWAKNASHFLVLLLNSTRLPGEDEVSKTADIWDSITESVAMCDQKIYRSCNMVCHFFPWQCCLSNSH